MKTRTSIIMVALITGLLMVLAVYSTLGWKKAVCRASRTETRLAQLRDSLRLLQHQYDSIRDALFDEQMFHLSYNDEAQDYLDKYFGQKENWENVIKDKLMDTNLSSGDNPLVPYAGMYGPVKIHAVRVLNHKWLIASFTDGKAWGEMIVEYEPAGPDSIRFKTVNALLYPVNP